jgi:hypothetical protein
MRCLLTTCGLVRLLCHSSCDMTCAALCAAVCGLQEEGRQHCCFLDSRVSISRSSRKGCSR